jgi:hypothetical protein
MQKDMVKGEKAGLAKEDVFEAAAPIFRSEIFAFR